MIAIDTAQLPAEDNEIFKYDAATDKFVLEADSTGGTGYWTDSGAYLEPTGGEYLVIAGTDQSSFAEGVVVNDGGGADEDDDFTVETTSYTDAFAIDAGDDSITINTGMIFTGVRGTTDDAELYTDTKGIYFEDPTDADDFKSIWRPKIACTITSIWAESDQTVTFMLQKDDGSPADLDSVDLAPAAGTAEDTSLDGDASFAAGDRLDLAITSVTNTPTWVSIQWTFTYDD